MSKKSNTDVQEAPATLTQGVDPTQMGISDLPQLWQSSSEDAAVPVSGASAPTEASDFVTPRLNLVQRIGELPNSFAPGTWVLNKEKQITEKLGDPLQVIVLTRPQKFYMEHLAYDPAGPKPRTFDSLEDVKAAGLTVEWDNINNIRASADRAARVTLLIAKPEHLPDDANFSIVVPEVGACAIASWLLTGNAYRMAARRLFTAEHIDLGGLPFFTMSWILRSQAIKSGGYPVFAPQIVPSRRLKDETVMAIKTRLNL
jgi:hypothetical protein